MSLIKVHFLNFFFLGFYTRHGKVGEVGSGQTGHRSKRVILSRLKTSSGQSGCGSGWVGPGWPIFFTWIFIFIYLFYKENNIYFPFGRLCNKLLDVKCIILNSPLISRMNSVKLINIYSIILILYKS